jgi:GNAT superfamily N-acetyltransferase
VTIDILVLSEPNPVFYAALGPLLGNPKEREIDAPIHHFEGKTWVIALANGEPRAWAAVFLNLHNLSVPVEFGSAYVLPEWRGLGYYARLLEVRLQLAGSRPVIARASPAAATILVKRGFGRIGMEGGRTLLLRPARTEQR